MKLKMFSWLLIVALLSSCGTAAGTYTGIFAGEAVSSVVDGFGERIESIINQVDDLISKRSFDIRQHLQILLDQLDQLDQVVGDNLDKTFEQLDQQQRQLLISIDYSLKEFESGMDVNLSKVEELLEKTVVFAGTLPGSKRIPTITGISPSYVSPVENTDVLIEVKGNWLAHGDPYLEVGDKVIQPQTKIDNELGFLVPLADYIELDRVNPLSMKLHVFKKRSLGVKPKRFEYKLGVFLVPAQMGTYQISAVVEQEKITYKDRYERGRHSNNHCQGGRNVDWTFNAQGKEWRIDVNSITDRATHVSTKSKYHGKRSVSEKSFQLHARVENNGNCEKVLGKVVAKDGRGVLEVEVSWREYKTDLVTVDLGELQSGALYWNQDIHIPLPENLKSFRLEIRQLNGVKKVVNETTNADWFKVRYSPKGNSILISPKLLSEALEL